MPSSPTLATYRTEVRRLLHDATGKFWSDAELNDYINDARNRVAADTACLRQLVVGYLNAGTEQYPIGGVTGALITNGGSGYLGTPSVSFVGGGGSGGTAVCTVSATRAISSITVTNPGQGYTSTPTAVITPAFGQVTGITLTNKGLGYWTPPTVNFSGGGGSGAAATATLGLVGAQGVFAAGSGYTAGDLLTVIGGTSTRPATLLALSTGGLTAWAVVDPGSYTSVPGTPITSGGTQVTQNVGLSGGTGTGAAIFAAWGVSSLAVSLPGTLYSSAPAVSFSGSSNVSAAATAAIGGTGSAAVIAPYIIPADVIDVLNVTPIRANQRVPLNYSPYTEFNARFRTLITNPQFPGWWSRYGTSGGSVFMQPVPNLAYQCEFDTAVLPAALVNDSDTDTLQYPYTSPVAYYAAWKAKLKQQSYAEAAEQLKLYGQKVLMAQASVMMRRIPNPYAGYTGA